MDVNVGDLIDKKYKILRRLGDGGMGVVYEGENVRIHARVAIKVLHAAVAKHPDAVERFAREAQAAGRIGSPHIVGVYDLGELADGTNYMVMEYLDGETLADRMDKSGKMRAREIAHLFAQLLDGLGAAHAAGIVHRDLKPENIFLVRNKAGEDFVKIVDFGISKFNSGAGLRMSMTRTGSVLGTPYYMSPEQARGTKTADSRSDLYSVGVVLFECVTAQVPFNADTFNELMFKIALEPTPDPIALVPDLDPTFAAIIRKALAREMEDRYQSAAEFLTAVSEWMGEAGLATASTSGQHSAFRSSSPNRELSGSPPGRARATPSAKEMIETLSATAGGSGPHRVALSGSLPNVASPVVTAKKSSRVKVIAISAAIAALMTALCARIAQRKDPPSVAHDGIEITNAAVTTAPPTAQPRAAADSPERAGGVNEAGAAAATPEATEAGAPAPLPLAGPPNPATAPPPTANGTTTTPHHHSHPPVAPPLTASPPPPAAPDPTTPGSTTVKGRTVRTDL